MINDPHFGFPTSNPGVVPRTSLIIRKNRLVIIFLQVTNYLNLSTSTIHQFYFIQVIKHHKLNTKENPCKSSRDYYYHECIERKLISTVGCRPSWINIKTSENKTCKSRESIRNYLEQMMMINALGPQAFATKYGCIAPCTYNEYRVDRLTIYYNILICNT